MNNQYSKPTLVVNENSFTLFQTKENTKLFRKIIDGILPKGIDTRFISENETFIRVKKTDIPLYKVLYSFLIAVVYSVTSQRKWQDLLLFKDQLYALIRIDDYIDIVVKTKSNLSLSNSVFSTFVGETAKMMSVFQMIELIYSSFYSKENNIFDKWNSAKIWISYSRKYFSFWLSVVRWHIWNFVPKKFVSWQKKFIYNKYVRYSKVKRRFAKNFDEVEAFVNAIKDLDSSILKLTMTGTLPYFSTEVYLADWGIIYASIEILKPKIPDVEPIIDSIIDLIIK